jgi:hypothetical protein
MSPDRLICPACHAPGAGDERFCARCGMPLVHADRPAGDLPVDEAHARARKIRPQYAEGPLVRVAGARHQAEAELIQGMLLEEGVPSMLRRTRGFDVPDMLAAGPRDVMVPLAGAGVAREKLLQAGLTRADAEGAGPAPGRLLAGLLAGVFLVAIIAWVGAALIG